jgi:hypothetical protein
VLRGRKHGDGQWSIAAAEVRRLKAEQDARALVAQRGRQDRRV